MGGDVFRDFYATLAQVLPVVLLAMLFDSRYLDVLARDHRPSRREKPKGGYFWTKPRVRVYVLTVASLLMCEFLCVFLVLGGLIDDRAWLRGVLIGGLTLFLGTLLTRVWVAVVAATAPTQPGRNATLDDERGRAVEPLDW
ncbi:hypothetical protein GA0070561_4969 [Micromonospora saelicesensis]|uniref:Uncharacterized protein n=1 Tax=Micromonospora saelicesensis TaxID=285676 RepID=A0A1C4Z658_9ACTN|nr:hypothetical protein GA0070561_4969 [Micromonospora saelicesensis]